MPPGHNSTIDQVKAGQHCSSTNGMSKWLGILS